MILADLDSGLKANVRIPRREDDQLKSKKPEPKSGLSIVF